MWRLRSKPAAMPNGSWRGVAVLSNTIAGIVAAQAEGLRRAVEPLPEKTRNRVAELLRKVMVTTDDDDAQELVLSLRELLADENGRSATASVSLERWARATPAIRAAADRLAVGKRRFAENVRARMTERGMSQTALAGKLGVAQPTIAEFLNGKHKPQPQTLHKLAKALRCKVTDLWPTDNGSR